MPSIYFIDSTTGVDLEVTGGEVTKDKLVESIEKAATKMQVLWGPNTRLSKYLNQAWANYLFWHKVFENYLKFRPLFSDKIKQIFWSISLRDLGSQLSRTKKNLHRNDYERSASNPLQAKGGSKFN